MADTPEFLAQRLRSEGQKTIETLRSFDDEHWQQRVYTEGAQWTLRQVLAHFLQAELSLLKLVENIAAGGPGSPDDFQLDAYNERQVAKLDQQPPQALIDQFGEARETTAARVALLSPADLDRQGRHPWLGIAPLVEIIKLIYRHNQIHLRDVRRSLNPSESA